MKITTQHHLLGLVYTQKQELFFFTAETAKKSSAFKKWALSKDEKKFVYDAKKNNCSTPPTGIGNKRDYI
ncbi:hypothetical protein MAQA_12156 [Listeria aquatica FSL S10-1188]|uniref:DNA polymerase I 3'-5' exonuclease domain-containing protein n=1 Tax=Listeria aquatica FSL S10-1188 TaxID=1265818 RepID=W7AWZ6_9LIST|nr:hypothetical protein MAQA_12156 [Listeria aquatica FSL S10-1188]